MRLHFVLALTLLSSPAASAQQCAEQATAPAASAITRQDALAHLRAAGAQVEPGGDFHGFQVGLAHTSDQIFVYYTLPDHSVVMGGTVVPASYDEVRRLVGPRAHDLSIVSGLRGMFVQNGTHFQVMYSTPDGQAVIVGRLWDGSGKDITRGQIKNIPGAVPTIRLTADHQGTTPSALAALAGGEIGDLHAPMAIMFIDPQCMYSIKAIHALMPAVNAGRLRLKVVPLSLLDYEDNGASTTNARSMVSFPNQEMVPAWVNGHLNQRAATPAADADAKLQANLTFAHQIALAGTPTFLWQHRNGDVGRLDGVPRDVDSFIASVSQ